MFQTKVVEKIKTHILCSVTFFIPKFMPFNEMVWKKTQNILLRFRYDNGYPKAPQCFVVNELPI